MKAIIGSGVKKPCGCGHLPTRVMKANNSNITPTLGGISNIEYKGNPVLKANRS